LDAALDWVDLSYADELMFGEQGNKADRLKQALASRRAALRVPSVPLDRSAAAAGDPRLGHPPARADAAFGRHASARFFEVSARLAQHDLGDPPAGYPELGEVRFLDAALRVREPWPTPRLQRFSFLDVKNLVPVTPFVRVLSWQGRIGVQRVFDARCRDCAAFAVELGTGATFADPRGRLAVWLLGASEILGHRLMRGIGDSPIRAALGPLAGLRVRLSARAVVLAEARALWAPAQVGPWTLAAQATLRVALGEHWAVDGRANVVDGAGEGSGALVIYF
jgi:hypothetical protein